MASVIAFTSNHRDLSTDTGFQFEFCCDRCSDGHEAGPGMGFCGNCGAASDG